MTNLLHRCLPLVVGLTVMDFPYTPDCSILISPATACDDETSARVVAFHTYGVEINLSERRNVSPRTEYFGSLHVDPSIKGLIENPWCRPGPSPGSLIAQTLRRLCPLPEEDAFLCWIAILELW